MLSLLRVAVVMVPLHSTEEHLKTPCIYFHTIVRNNNCPLQEQIQYKQVHFVQVCRCPSLLNLSCGRFIIVEKMRILSAPIRHHILDAEAQN